MPKVYVCYTIKPGEEYGCEIKTNKAAFTDKTLAEKWCREINEDVARFQRFDESNEAKGLQHAQYNIVRAEFAKSLPTYQDGRIDPMEPSCAPGPGLDYVDVMFTRAGYDELYVLDTLTNGLKQKIS